MYIHMDSTIYLFGMCLPDSGDSKNFFVILSVSYDVCLEFWLVLRAGYIGNSIINKKISRCIMC
jgi:hypothetical protein